MGRGESVAFLKEVDANNLRRRQSVVTLAVEALDGQVNGKKIAVLGLAFKPHSDDIRDSPALDVAVQLKGLGANVVATDPEAIHTASRVHPQLSYEADLATALQDADLVVLVTEWDEFRHMDPSWALPLVKTATVIDGRNTLDATAWRAAGWTYIGLGRP